MFIILVIASILSLFPFYWMIISAFKTRQEMGKYPPSFIPAEFTLDNFKTVLTQSNLKIYLINSLVVAAIQAILMLVVTIPAAYGFLRLKIKHKKILFYILLIINSLPFEVVMVYNYKLIIQLNLNDTLTALILPYIFKFYNVYLIYDAFSSIPPSLYYAARLDRASELKFLMKIAIPYTRPTILFTTILNVISSWNAFLWPMMITNSHLTRTLPLGVYTYITEIGSKNELVLTMSTISEIPVIIVFLIFRKRFIYSYKR